jgi:hypothetical protein
MANTSSRDGAPASEGSALAALHDADRAFPFGPSFFLERLHSFMRESCPDPRDSLPVVHLHLADGCTLNVCHIVGVSPHWVVLAVADAAGHGEAMAIECVPFGLIHRVAIQARHAKSTAAGFRQNQPPAVIAAEALLRSAMAADSGANLPRSPADNKEAC